MASEVEKEMGWVRVDEFGENRGCGPPARLGGGVATGHCRETDFMTKQSESWVRPSLEEADVRFLGKVAPVNLLKRFGGGKIRNLYNLAQHDV